MQKVASVKGNPETTGPNRGWMGWLAGEPTFTHDDSMKMVSGSRAGLWCSCDGDDWQREECTDLNTSKLETRNTGRNRIRKLLNRVSTTDDLATNGWKTGVDILVILIAYDCQVRVINEAGSGNCAGMRRPGPHT